MARKGKKYNKTANTKVSGIHIYNDEHGRCVYYDVLTKIGYIVDDREQSYRTYAMRFILGLIAAILVYMFELPLWICAIVGVGVYIVMEVKFRIFLRGIPQLLDFKPEKRVGYVDSATNDTSNKILLKILLYLALAILIVVNAYQQHYEGIMLAANWIICVFGIVFAIIQILAYVKKAKMEKAK